MNYQYYNGVGTWDGWQPIIWTLQDRNHRPLLDKPVYSENTPRQRCWYGRPTTVTKRFALPTQIYFHDIAYVTITIPRVAGKQRPC